MYFVNRTAHHPRANPRLDGKRARHAPDLSGPYLENCTVLPTGPCNDRANSYTLVGLPQAFGAIKAPGETRRVR